MQRKQNRDRIVNCRQRRKLILFAAEGHNKTETYYLQDFIRDVGNLTLRRSRDASTDPVGMVKGLVDAMDEFDFDAENGDLAFCLFDMDCNQDKESQIRQAMQIANKHNIEIIMSNPCFELWFICHFTASPRYYSSSSELCKDMNRFINGYCKSKEGIYSLLKNNLTIAISNAEALEKKALQAGYNKLTADFSPTTEMYKLIRSIFKCANSFL